ncbi:class I SAM-dependent methyltransferase, partial [Escherichia coli]|uniref:class I SAM-dependent methyltransferase n=1 Tax=Escherichia coli TaxID=562 RepID=UPI0005C642ED
LKEITKEVGEFDLIVASHVIEHVPDLIGWLKDAISVLKVGGTLALVVPDKRFTFDILRPLATYREVAAAHKEARHRPGLRCI